MSTRPTPPHPPTLTPTQTPGVALKHARGRDSNIAYVGVIITPPPSCHLEVFRARLVELALVHLEHGVEDHRGAGETDASAADGHPYVRLHGVRGRHASIRGVRQHGHERHAFSTESVHRHGYLQGYERQEAGGV